MTPFIHKKLSFLSILFIDFGAKNRVFQWFFQQKFSVFSLKNLTKTDFFIFVFCCFCMLFEDFKLENFFSSAEKNIFSSEKILEFLNFFQFFFQNFLKFQPKIYFSRRRFCLLHPKIFDFTAHTRVSTRTRLLYFYNFSFLFFIIYKARHKKKLQPKLEFFDCLAAINALRIEVPYVLCGDRISYVLLHGGHV